MRQHHSLTDGRWHGVSTPLHTCRLKRMLRNRLGSTLALYGVHQTTVVESGLASMAQAESNVEDRVRAHWLRVPQEVIWAGGEERVRAHWLRVPQEVIWAGRGGEVRHTLCAIDDCTHSSHNRKRSYRGGRVSGGGRLRRKHG